jgi:tetratricopeptide (TPR) repeat protein
MHPLLSIVSLAFMLIAVSAPPAAADDRTCFSGAYTGPVWDDRVAACTRLIAEKKDLVRAYVQRGRLYVRRGDNWDQAIADFAEALRLDPKNVEALSLHGVLTFNRGDTARAVAEMNEAIQLNLQIGSRAQFHRLLPQCEGRLRPCARRTQRGDPARSEIRLCL